MPQLWIVAGPNGAGKTTCVQRKPIADILPGILFLNPDAVTLRKLREEGIPSFADAPVERLKALFLESANEVEAELHAALSDGRSVGVETVLSTKKYLPLIQMTRAAGGFVGLIYIALASPGLAGERVARRVREGGHDVPERKVTDRWQRSLDHLPEFARLATRFWIIDNSNSDLGVAPALLAVGGEGRLEFRSPDAFDEMRIALDSF